ncbi:type II toxin-antitoxin system VapC family toxin [Candidatus Poribacteria bacterium]|nr:type II toxin-antitoxin system VapC family toxin [Candidatus Poribacteria bacterium]
MNLLLDTHVLLWWLDDPSLLSQQAMESIKQPDNNVTVSVVSAWEIAIKKRLGKLEAPENLKESVAASGFQWLSVVYEHVWRVKDLPFHHEDPFDRLLIAQADIEDLTFVTRDSRIKAYSIPLLDA